MVQVTKYAGQVYYLSAGAQGTELQLPAALNIDGIVLPISVELVFAPVVSGLSVDKESGLVNVSSVTKVVFVAPTVWVVFCDSSGAEVTVVGKPSVLSELEAVE